MKFLNPSLDALYGLRSAYPDWQLSNGLVMVSGSGKPLCPPPKFSLLSNLSSSWSTLNLNARNMNNYLSQFLPVPLIDAKFLSALPEADTEEAPALCSRRSSPCLSSLPGVSSSWDTHNSAPR